MKQNNNKNLEQQGKNWLFVPDSKERKKLKKCQKPSQFVILPAM